ncbi:shikimate dehydrogenase [Frigidibacter sp. MR17.14]|uniref:shikimate dehydrogenase family protein n=1 Tax=Frigidibacter sp. MR17.14 TaxID=3126509 RepID=UPI003012E257
MNALPQIDGETLLYPIAGHPIGQVKSPTHLSALMARDAINALVIPAHVLPGDLGPWLESLERWQNVPGVVLTVPHKAAGLAFCSRVSKRARAASAVNILVRDPRGGWTGDATDGAGHLDGIAAHGFDVAGRRALLVGTGGAGAAIAYEILARGAATLALHDIDAARRDALITRLAPEFPGRLQVGSADPTGFDLVANATPLGMREGDPLPVQTDRLTPAQFVSDVVTKPAVPALIAAARAKGCATMAGTEMFEAQAQLLADILTGRRGIEA